VSAQISTVRRDRWIALGVLLAIMATWQILSTVYTAEAVPGEPMIAGWQVLATKTFLSMADYWQGGLGVPSVGEGADRTYLAATLSLLGHSFDTILRLAVGLLLGGVFGISLGKHVTQSGFYDEGSQSVKASVLGDETYGRDRTSHVVATFATPDGKTVDDPAWRDKVVAELNKFKADHPDQVVGWAGWLAAPNSDNPLIKGMVSEDKKHTFVSIPLKGDDDDSILNNYKAIAPDLQKLGGGNVELVLAPGMVVDANGLSARHSQLAISTDAGDDTPETLHVRLVGRMRHARISTRWQAPRR